MRWPLGLQCVWTGACGPGGEGAGTRIHVYAQPTYHQTWRPCNKACRWCAPCSVLSALCSLLQENPRHTHSTLCHLTRATHSLQAEVVAADERESSEGVRATLNLGHTFGHAIETGTGYGTWLHGEAVAAGTAMAADLSYRLVRGARGRP